MSKSYQYHSEFSSYPSSAIQAKHLGKTYFFTGKPCTNGHLYLKYASSGNCVKCIEKRRGTVEINFRGKSSKRTIANQKLAELALINGFTTYTPIEPCKHGHKERYVGNNNCVQCNENSSKQRKEKAKWARIKKVYGITECDFINMKLLQNNKCSICSINLYESNTHIDHCHKTKKVRSLLCNRCNQAIGLLDENSKKFENAVKYLKYYNAT